MRRSLTIVLALAVGCVGLLIAYPVAFAPAQEKTKGDRVKWEYHEEEFYGANRGNPEKVLQELGEQGWELVAVTLSPRIPTPKSFDPRTGKIDIDLSLDIKTYYFKRQKGE